MSEDATYDGGASTGQRPANLVVTYHYVRPANSDGVTGLTPESFAAQIRAIQQEYTIVSTDAFAARERRETGLALITFDDAVLDQYRYAAPVLQALGATAVFFAPMCPFVRDPADEAERWTSQHLLHALAEHLGWGALEQRVDRILADRGLARRVDQEAMNRLYHYEVPPKRRLKYLIAFALESEIARAILTDVNASVGLSARDWFMSRDHLRDLERRGFQIGGHGFAHVPLTTLSPAGQRDDLLRARDLLDEMLGLRPRPLAYPFGRYDACTEAIAAELGYTRCFGTDERVDANRIDRIFALPEPRTAPVSVCARP